MKKTTIYLLKRLPAFLMLAIFGTVIILSSSCKGEDDIPPPSAYVPPEVDTTGACPYINTLPELSIDMAVDFECEGPGVFTFFGEKDGALTVMPAENPVSGGINTSERVIQVTQTAGLEPWAGFFFDLSAKVDFSTFDDIKIKVYSPAAGQMVNLKLEDSADGGIATEIAVPTTVANEWEELCFPFAAAESDKYDRFVLFFDFLGPKDAETTHYFDDIIIGEGCMVGGGPMDEPTMAAPSPILPASDVLSIFSDVYMNVPGTDFNPDWGQATVVTEVDIAGDNTLRYENLNYQGVVLGNTIDVSGMSFLHVDFWTADAMSFNGFLISSGPVETAHAFDIMTDQWVSVDIPLSEFSSVVDLMDVIQMKFDGNGTIYLDNIYFHMGQPAGPSIAAPIPTTPESDVISVYSDSYTNVADTDFNPNWGQATIVSEVDLGGNNALVYENLNYQGTQFSMPLDVSGMTTLHIDYWTETSSGFNGFLISTGPLETPYAFTVTSGEWVSVDIPLSEFSTVVDLMDVIQMKFDGDGTIYLDNIYFYVEQATAPSTPAPMPMQAAADVISVYSDAYMSISGTDFNPNWGQATLVSELEIAGDNILVYENLNYQGTQFESSIDVSGMTTLHIDYWTADSNGFNGFLISPGPLETPHNFVVTTGEWVSVDIPLSTFSGVVDLTDVFQMKFDGDGTIYLDNIYFY